MVTIKLEALHLAAADPQLSEDECRCNVPDKHQCVAARQAVGRDKFPDEKPRVND